MQELFQTIKRIHQLVRRRGHEAGGGQGAAGAADPVLRAAEFAGGFLPAANLAATAVHQFGVDFANQAQTQGEVLGQAPQAVVHGAHVVEDFFHILRRVVGGGSGLECQHVFKRALRAFDLRRQHGFVPHIHGDEQVGVGQHIGDGVKPRQVAVGVGEPGLQLTIENDRRFGRQRLGHEGAVASGLLDVTAGAVGWGGHGVRLNRSALGCILFKKKTQFLIVRVRRPGCLSCAGKKTVFMLMVDQV